MTIHSHSTWDFGDPITEELINEIVYIIKANGRVLSFALCSRVDQFAYIFMENITPEDIERENSMQPHFNQLREIYIRTQNKLNET